MNTPTEAYRPSTRPYRGIGELEYSFHDKTVSVTRRVRICYNGQNVNLSIEPPTRGFSAFPLTDLRAPSAT